MTDQNKKRSKNDERRQHVERRSGEKHKHRLQQEKINEADRLIRDYCATFEEHSNVED